MEHILIYWLSASYLAEGAHHGMEFAPRPGQCFATAAVLRQNNNNECILSTLEINTEEFWRIYKKLRCDGRERATEQPLGFEKIQLF